MLTIRTEVSVPGLTGHQITDFLLDPTDERYRRWWPGTHFRFHVVRRGGADHRGDVVLMDEYVGPRHLHLDATVTEALPGRRIVWRFGSRIPLPVRLSLDLVNRHDGVDVRHTITAGYTGIGRILDPLLRLYFNHDFAAAMHDHAHQEFRRLPQRLTRNHA